MFLFPSSSWKVSWVSWREPELPNIAAYIVGEIPRQCDPGVCSCHLQKLHQEELAHSKLVVVAWILEQMLWVVLVLLSQCWHDKCYFVFCLFQIEDEPNKISDPDRTTIKANIVNLMLSSPEQIQKQVCLHKRQDLLPAYLLYIKSVSWCWFELL